MRKSIYIIIILALILNCKSNDFHIVEQKPKYMLIDGGKFYKKSGVILTDTIRNDNNSHTCFLIADYIPSFNDVIKMESLIQKKHDKKYAKYYRQYYGYITKNHDTLIEALMLNRKDIRKFKKWKKSIYEVEDYIFYIKPVKKKKEVIQSRFIYQKNKGLINSDSIYKKIDETYFDLDDPTITPPPCFKDKINTK